VLNITTFQSETSFEKIIVSSRSPATYRRSTTTCQQQIYCWRCQQKKFDNRTAFSNVTGKTTVAPVFKLPVHTHNTQKYFTSSRWDNCYLLSKHDKHTDTTTVTQTLWAILSHLWQDTIIKAS